MKRPVPLDVAYALLAGGPVALVTAQAKGRHSIMPAGWVTPVSMKPPMVAVAINQTHFTAELIRRSEEFVLSIPSSELVRQVKYCGSVSGRDVDKWAQTGLHQAEPSRIATPLVDGCLAHLECGLVAVHEVGDHLLFVGEVLTAQVEEGAFEERWKLEAREAKPLHHLGGDWYAVLEAAFEG